MAQFPIDPLVQRRLDVLERVIDDEYDRSAKVFEARTGIKMAQVSQWFTGYRALRDKALRRLEEKTRKPVGYFDQAGSDEVVPTDRRGSVFEAVTPDEHELLDFFRNMDDDDYDDLVREAAKRSAKFKAMQARIMAKIGVKTKDAEVANATKGIIARASLAAGAKLKQRTLFDTPSRVRPPIAGEPEPPFARDDDG